jgi:hypothetical protein
MATPGKAACLILGLALLGGIVALVAVRLAQQPDQTSTTRVARRPVWRSDLDGAPPEVREFLGRVLDKVPENGAGVTGYQFDHWEREGKPTHVAVGLKAVPGVDPEELIARVMDVDGYVGRIAHVEVSRSEPDPAFRPPEEVRFFQSIRVPRIATVQQELVLVDAGTLRGYRVAYWYLLRDESRSLDPQHGARSDFNVGAWLAAPGVVGYALSSWPRRDDLNAFQWASLTTGANALAKTVVEGNIDGMVAWATSSEEVGRPGRRPVGPSDPAPGAAAGGPGVQARPRANRDRIQSGQSH